MIAEEMIEAAARAMNPKLFSGVAHIEHREASPLEVSHAKAKVLETARCALEAASQADTPASAAGEWVMVPREPTGAILRQLFTMNSGTARTTAEATAVWEAILNLASPPATSQSDAWKALEALTKAVGAMKVPQTIENAALQLHVTVGPAYAAAVVALASPPVAAKEAVDDREAILKRLEMAEKFRDAAILTADESTAEIDRLLDAFQEFVNRVTSVSGKVSYRHVETALSALSRTTEEEG